MEKWGAAEGGTCYELKGGGGGGIGTPPHICSCGKSKGYTRILPLLQISPEQCIFTIHTRTRCNTTHTGKAQSTEC